MAQDEEVEYSVLTRMVDDKEVSEEDQVDAFLFWLRMRLALRLLVTNTLELGEK